MRKWSVLLVAVVFAVGGCSDDDDGNAVLEPDLVYPSPTVAGSPEFRQETALIEGDEGSVLIPIEVADSDETRSFGLMKRTSLPDDYGMAFIWFEDQDCCFWMKDTLVPLSIAFFDVDGKIVKILDMEPCKKDPCPLYDPDVTYRGALEVKQGQFEEWGVDEGSVIRIQ